VKKKVKVLSKSSILSKKEPRDVADFNYKDGYAASWWSKKPGEHW